MRPTPRAEEAEAGGAKQAASGTARLGVRMARGAMTGLFSGAAGGAFAGLVETALAWMGARQYLAGLGGRLRLGFFMCALEGLFGALAGCATFTLAALLW